MGTYKNPHFAIRIPAPLLAKLKYVAEFNGRSANKEIEQLVKDHISTFEKTHGEIVVESAPQAD